MNNGGVDERNVLEDGELKIESGRLKMANRELVLALLAWFYGSNGGFAAGKCVASFNFKVESSKNGKRGVFVAFE